MTETKKVAILRTFENHKEVNEIMNKATGFGWDLHGEYMHWPICGGYYNWVHVQPGYFLTASVQEFREAVDFKWDGNANADLRKVVSSFQKCCKIQEQLIRAYFRFSQMNDKEYVEKYIEAQDWIRFMKEKKETYQLITTLQEQLNKLDFMDKNGLEPQDMKNDITYPHEL